MNIKVELIVNEKNEIPVEGRKRGRKSRKKTILQYVGRVKKLSFSSKNALQSSKVNKASNESESYEKL